MAIGTGIANSPWGKRAILWGVDKVWEACHNDSADDDDDVDDNCEALYQSILQTCAGLTGQAKFRCFEAARISRDQCYQERK